jgi:hypothetical protein
LCQAAYDALRLRLSETKALLGPSERASLNSELNELRNKNRIYAVHKKQWEVHAAISALPFICIADTTSSNKKKQNKTKTKQNKTKNTAGRIEVQSHLSCHLCTDAGHAVVIGPHAFLLDGFLARVLLCFIDILVAFLAEDFVSRYANGTARATVRVEP